MATITPQEARARFPEAMRVRDDLVKLGMEDEYNCTFCGIGKLCNWLPEEHVQADGRHGGFYSHDFELINGQLWDSAGDYGGGYVMVWDGAEWREPTEAEDDARDAYYQSGLNK